MSADHFHIPKKWVYVAVLIAACSGLAFYIFTNQYVERDPAASTPPAVSSLPAPLQPTPMTTSEVSLFRCDDLYQKLCRSTAKRDPSGRVPSNYEGEAGVLRIFERLIRAHPDLPPAEIDELLARRIYTPERTGLIRDLYANIQREMMEFFGRKKALTALQSEKLKQTLEAVLLELPPPASVYADEPDLLTLDNAYYYRTKEGVQKIRIGGAQIYGITSRYNLAFTLAHELAHSVGPCELDAMGVHIPAYDDFLTCIGMDTQKLPQVCKGKTQFPEVAADWVATQIVAGLIQNQQSLYGPRETRVAIFNAVRDICPDDLDDDDDDDSAEEDAADLSSYHPSSEYRINGIFGKSPMIQSLVGCVSAKQQESSYGLPSKCYQQ